MSGPWVHRLRALDVTHVARDQRDELERLVKPIPCGDARPRCRDEVTLLSARLRLMTDHHHPGNQGQSATGVDLRDPRDELRDSVGSTTGVCHAAPGGPSHNFVGRERLNPARRAAEANDRETPAL
jgi:hypothetical protein